MLAFSHPSSFPPFGAQGLPLSLKDFFATAKCSDKFAYRRLCGNLVKNFGVLKTSVKQPQEQSKTLRLGLLMQGAGFGVPCLAQGAEFSGAVACQTFLP